MSETKTVEMRLVATDEQKGAFIFDMQPQSNPNRTVRFSIDQVDARTMYESLGRYLNVKPK
jgi:hypothetical protein